MCVTGGFSQIRSHFDLAIKLTLQYDGAGVCSAVAKTICNILSTWNVTYTERQYASNCLWL